MGCVCVFVVNQMKQPLYCFIQLDMFNKSRGADGVVLFNSSRFPCTCGPCPSFGADQRFVTDNANMGYTLPLYQLLQASWKQALLSKLCLESSIETNKGQRES